ncbi:GNAT family N-acetyltransferase [Agarivorans sp. TSD2052]|uniref:GNAT family N-acetyltransferase n=1 Tax=Agarivorans sp. TSD2052 TaxID=2937286 RepID=UPI00200FE39F|nr:GNAT family N-acetyltransferase [Agarivorans sp. TSD2052]UPW19014.1 GNAT family N-acetyltransferase [Agarivorans sp. TSD2052]
MSVNIIKAGLMHLDTVAELFNQYRIFYQQADDLSLATAFIEQRMQGQQSTILIALSDYQQQQALGFIQLYPSFSSTRAKPILILNDLYVREAARGQGVARSLMNAAKQYALDLDAIALELATAVDNHPAQALYEGLGYKKDLEFYHYELDVNR